MELVNELNNKVEEQRALLSSLQRVRAEAKAEVRVAEEARAEAEEAASQAKDEAARAVAEANTIRGELLRLQKEHAVLKSRMQPEANREKAPPDEGEKPMTAAQMNCKAAKAAKAAAASGGAEEPAPKPEGKIHRVEPKFAS